MFFSRFLLSENAITSQRVLTHIITQQCVSAVVITVWNRKYGKSHPSNMESKAFHNGVGKAVGVHSATLSLLSVIFIW